MQLVDRATEHAAAIRDAAENQVAHLGDVAKRQASELGARAGQRLDAVRQAATRATNQAGRNTRQHILEARARLTYWKSKYPMRTIAAVGGAAFVIGVAVRIWRSHDE